MQDWVTIRQPSSVTLVRQSPSDWLDLEGIRDVSMWIHVSDVTSTVALQVQLETSPTVDEALFQTVTMQTSPATLTAAGVYVAVSRANVAAVPLARHLRWAVATSGAADWNVTFRIVLALNPVVRDFCMRRGDELVGAPFLAAEGS